MMTTPRSRPADPANNAGITAGGLGAALDRSSHSPIANHAAVDSSAPRGVPAWPGFLRRPARYPNAYCWYVLVCALDLMLTNTAIHHAGAIEVNGLAARAIEMAGFWGLIGLKVGTMLVVLLSCELIGDACVRKGHPRDTGLRVAEWAVAISAIPVVLTLLQLGFLGVANLMVA